MKQRKTQNKLSSFLFEITDELYIERVHNVRRRGVNANNNNTPRTIVTKLLDYK